MSKNLEIECKSMLTKADYLSLLKNNKYQSYEQNNFYIDDEEFSLIKMKSGLRIRFKNNEYELTLKVKRGVARLEINQMISAQQFDNFINKNIFPKGEVEDEIISLGIKIETLKMFGSLSTTRTDIFYHDSLISIDKNTYLGKTDYEIECESNSMDLARKNLQQFLLENNIKFVENKINKIQRVINSL